MIRAIFACDLEWGIGKQGTIPWPKNTHDLRWFKETTINSVVVMGKNTWNDPLLPKPLPNRYNILVSDSGIESSDTRPNIVIKRAEVEKYITNIDKDVWLIGGAALIKSNLHLVTELWLNRININYYCDTFLPKDAIVSEFTLHKHHKDQNLNIEMWSRTDKKN
jgi:dihydrofolate reductase